MEVGQHCVPGLMNDRFMEQAVGMEQLDAVSRPVEDKQAELEAVVRQLRDMKGCHKIGRG